MIARMLQSLFLPRSSLNILAGICRPNRVLGCRIPVLASSPSRTDVVPPIVGLNLCCEVAELVLLGVDIILSY